MLKRFWNWLKNLFRRLFGKPAPPEPTPEKTARTDAEYEQVFLRMLDDLAAGEGRGGLQAVLMMARIPAEDLVPWVERFGARLRENPETHAELAGQLMAFGRTFGGKLGKATEDAAWGVLEQLPEPEPEPVVAGGFWEGEVVEAEFVEEMGGVLEMQEEATGQTEKEMEEIGTDQHWFQQGLEQFKMQNYQEALAAFDKSIELNPNFHGSWNGRGTALSYLGRYEEAIAAASKALELKPDDRLAWYNRGLYLADLGYHEEAIANYDKAVELQPDFHLAWHYRGISLSSLKRNREAIASFDKVLELEPDFQETLSKRNEILKELEYAETDDRSLEEGGDAEPSKH